MYWISLSCYVAVHHPSAPAPHSQETIPQPFFPPKSLHFWIQNNPAFSNFCYQIQIRTSFCIFEESFLAPLTSVLLFWVLPFLSHYKLLQEEEGSVCHVFHHWRELWHLEHGRCCILQHSMNYIFIIHISILKFLRSPIRTCVFRSVWPKISPSSDQEINYFQCLCMCVCTHA